MEVGSKVIVNREGDLIPVKLPVETDGEMHAVERFYSADALEVSI